MSRRTPFPFHDHHDPAEFTHLPDGFIAGLIDSYEFALRDEYASGDIDTASYNEGLRQAREEVLVDLLGIDQAVMDAYWGRTARPEPATHDLPSQADVLIDYDQVAEWSGKRLNTEQWDALDAAIPHSSIPDAIGEIVSALIDNATDETRRTERPNPRGDRP